VLVTKVESGLLPVGAMFQSKELAIRKATRPTSVKSHACTWFQNTLATSEIRAVMVSRTVHVIVV